MFWEGVKASPRQIDNEILTNGAPTHGSSGPLGDVFKHLLYFNCLPAVIWPYVWPLTSYLKR